MSAGPPEAHRRGGSSEDGARSAGLRFLREAANGPASVVWAAERVGAGGPPRPVAVKVLQHRAPRDAEMLLAARDRARTLATTGHKHLTPIEDVARVGDRLALVSPWVDGIDLLEWVEVLRERDVVLPGRVACDLVREIASALDVALNAVPPTGTEPLGLMHRDLKPSNVMIARDGGVRVLDFGTGFTSIAGRAARAGVLQKGLARYLSPGRRDGKREGPPSDVYALGILAVELLRGRWLRRLHGHNPAHDRHLAEVVARLDGLGMRTQADDRTLRNVLLRMVAFDPEARPTVMEVALTFRTLADRADGPSLASFATAYALPLLTPPALAPAPGVQQPEAEILGDDPRAVPEVAETPPASPAREAGGDWVETAEGWRPAAQAQEEEDTLDEDEIAALTPPPARSRSTAPPPAPPPILPPDEPSATDEVPFRPETDEKPRHSASEATTTQTTTVSRRRAPPPTPWFALVAAGFIGALLALALAGLGIAVWWSW
jgi:serine/threonine protein kinase